MANANATPPSQAAAAKSESNGTTSTTKSLLSNSLASEVAFLQEFISSPPTEEDATSNLASLLQQLDVADGVAQGVESKLDKLLENLEEMLEGLEGKDRETSVDEEASDVQDKPDSLKPSSQSTNSKDAR